jgi:hypothetical protein
MKDLKAKVEGYLKKAKPLFEGLRKAEDPKSKRVYEMAMAYYRDAQHFYEEGNYVNALAALEYAEGWMDAGKEVGLLGQVAH